VLLANVAIIAAHGVARWISGAEAPAKVAGVGNLRVVDERVWRGRAPSEQSYRDLAAAGVTTVVDLRAERRLDIPTDLLEELGIERVSIPIRDGQTPTGEQVAAFVDAVAASEGRVFLHCGAGVGRTGVMAAAYLATTGQDRALHSLGRNLEVGPPSVEQIWYALDFDGESAGAPPAVVTAVSRVLDAPRRIWSAARS
jgi:protein-tyrosine phosphatase